MHKKSSNKSFGILFFIIFLGLGLWPLTEDLSANIYLIFISLLFLILGIINSKILTPFNKAWIKLGEILGRLIAPAVMALIYFFILTPISLIVRIFGKDLLNLKFFDQKKSYWINRKKDSGKMNKQF